MKAVMLDLPDGLQATAEPLAFVAPDDDDGEKIVGHGCSRAAATGCARCGRIRAGTPTAMLFAGTSQSTTALAPIAQSLPIAIGPRSFAPAPISTRSPIRGAPRTP